MNVGCRKGKKAFSKLIYQPLQKANCFLDYIHLNENRQFSQRKLLAKQSFAVEILEFRLSIIVITKNGVKYIVADGKITDRLKRRQNYE